MSWIQTRSGKRFDVLDPTPESIDINDIAHALSHICRFTGHTSAFFSVAQHSVEVSWMVPREDALWALLHDASEAYLCDVSRPVKQLPEMAGYRAIEARLQAAIYARFGLHGEPPASVKDADNRQLTREALGFMSPLHQDWWPHIDQSVPRHSGFELKPDQAQKSFLLAFFKYGGVA